MVTYIFSRERNHAPSLKTTPTKLPNAQLIQISEPSLLKSGSVQRAPSSDANTPSLSPAASLPLNANAPAICQFPDQDMHEWHSTLQRSPTEYIYKPFTPNVRATAASGPGPRTMIGYFESVLLKPAHNKFLAILNQSEQNNREFSAALGYKPLSQLPTSSSDTLLVANAPQPVHTPEEEPVGTPETPRRPTRPRACPLLSPRRPTSPTGSSPKISPRSTVSAMERASLQAGEADRCAFYGQRAYTHGANEGWRSTHTRMMTVESVLTMAAQRSKLTTTALERFDRIEEEEVDSDSVSSSAVAEKRSLRADEEKGRKLKRRNRDARGWILDWVQKTSTDNKRA
ncbi:hypothetical protein CROQUDRAFT_655933 [Cronartium quercuum f. sp. fusiforme G11]|uniref:Uncharacterized protein n=1 Tax=Cronartium quercuum f. sp. fusiforme G11 TaxID=708437 RepID=A0A9P6NQ52_9BASI|nr:hypothetical protein CROQUDRAFT_655933 [Cronartium quercuum f. sp. fusiforme G11]